MNTFDERRDQIAATQLYLNRDKTGKKEKKKNEGRKQQQPFLTPFFFFFKKKTPLLTST